LWRYGDLLPVDEADAVTLGEGNTPLLALPRLTKMLGLESVFAKDETREPTGSFKDRLACVGVAVARARGARVIVSSSSGNAGAAAAAYAARAGLGCVVFTTADAPAPLVAQMRAFGALVGYTRESADRLVLVQEAVRRPGWFSISPFGLPVTGSNPLALEGTKTIAYEIAEAMGWDVPDWCVLPVCYGDALAGVQRGFAEMVALGWTRRVPRLVAAETSGSLGAAIAADTDILPDIARNAPSIASSIAASRGTFQALDALRRCGGRAVTVDDAALLHWQRLLAHHEGLWVEPSSAAAFAAVATLVADGSIGTADQVVVLATASGLKGAVMPAPPVPEVPVTLDAALAVLHAAYGTAAP
jgi:threonine synthase